MIAKRIAAPKGRTNFKSLVSYILREGKGKGEGVAGFNVTNCEFKNPQTAVKEVLATQARNTRSRNNPNYHLVVSFPEGEKPDAAQLQDMEISICDKLGLRDHQRISAIHDDTDHYHLHIAINKVHPVSHNMMEPYYDKKALVEIVAELEERHHLTPVCSLKIKDKELRNSGSDTLQVHSGIESFADYMKQHKTTVEGALQSGQDWTDFNKTLSKIGVVLKPRGAGLVFSTLDEKFNMPAGKLGRKFTKKSLESKLGVYQVYDKQQAAKQKTVSEYKPLPRAATAGTNQLYAEFLQQKQTRSAELKNFYATKKSLLELLNKEKKIKREAIKNNKKLNGLTKRKAYQDLTVTYQRQRQALLLDFRQKKEVISKNNQGGSWQKWLISQASNGNEKALVALRSASTRRKIPGQFAFLSVSGEAINAVLTELKPVVNQHGDVIYQHNGTELKDSGQQISIKTDEEQAITEALVFAQKRYGSVLDIKGNAAFKAAVVESAVKNGLSIRFIDPAMEQSRQALLGVRQKLQTPGTRQALGEWIEQRNQTRLRVTDLAEHRRWIPEDAGPVIYRGIRNIGNESFALYDKNRKLRLVAAVNQQQQQLLKNVKTGTGLNITKDGTITVQREKGADFER